MVRDLVGLVTWMNVLRQGEPAAQLPYQAQGCSSAYSWTLQMLSLCPRLARTDLFFTSQFDLNLVLKAIEPSASTLRSIRFRTVSRLDGSRSTLLTPLRYVESALRSPVLRRICRLTLVDIYDTSSQTARSLIAPSLSSLLIHEAVGKSNLLQLIPENLSMLRYLSLRTQTNRPFPPDLSPIFARLTSSIQEISFVTFARFTIAPALSQYLLPSPSTPIIPLEHFLRFPNLRSLQLCGFIGPSLSLLQQLASSCPLLSLIDFEESFWISNDSTLGYSATDLYYEAIFPEDCITLEFKKLSKLRELNLGYLPTSDPSKFSKLEKSMKERSIKLTWTMCRGARQMCGCGYYHYDEDSD